MDYVGDYNPMLSDKFGLSSFLHSKDLINTLNDCFNMVDVSANDSLHYESVMEDFNRNGITVELDEVDKYQSRMRSLNARPAERCDNANDSLPSATVSGRSRVNKKAGTKVKVCVFCKNNEEQPSVYRSHVLKDNAGRVTCPVLRKYTCPKCGAVGDNAHTIRYCPQNTETGFRCLLSEIKS